MSKILRRPMFRGGGKVSSYGNGITTGLANGGRVGFYRGGGTSTYAQNYNLIDWGKSQGQNLQNTGQKILENAKNKVSSSASKGRNFLSNKAKYLNPNKIPGDEQLWKSVKKYGKKIGKFKLPGLAYRNPVTIGLPAALGIKASLIAPTEADKEYGVKDWEKVIASSLPGGDQNLPLMLRKALGVEKKVDQEPPTGIIGPPGGGDPDMYAEKPVPPPALTMKEQVAKDKALFADLLGEGEARGKDVSDMLLRFAGSGGDTIGEKFQQYIGNEAQAGPSRTEKINQAAASLAINDYIAGKRSKENMEMMIEKTKFGVDYTIKAQEARDDIKSMTFSDGLISYAKNVMGGRKNPMSDIVIKGVLSIQMPGKQINSKILTKQNKGEIKTEDLDIGLNIVTYKGGKGIFEKISDTEIKELTELPIT